MMKLMMEVIMEIINTINLKYYHTYNFHDMNSFLDLKFKFTLRFFASGIIFFIYMGINQ